MRGPCGIARSACTLAVLASIVPLLAHCGKGSEKVVAPAAPTPRSKISAPRVLAQASEGSPFRPKQKDFSSLDDAQKAALAKLETEFWQSTNRDRQNEILDKIADEFCGEETLGFLEKLLSSNDEDFRRRAIEMLSGTTSPAALALFTKALTDPSETVRRESVEAAVNIRGEGVPEYLGKVFEDSSAQVRLTGFDVLEDQPDKQKLQGFDKALQSKNRDVRTTAIDNLQLEGTQKSLQVLFNGLDSPDAETRDHARFSIDFLVDHEFRSTAEAQSWWQTHRSKFDKDLVPSE
jgi:HEAT repeat protein